ncbi:MAG: GNAT family N-acetyltransferase [Alphaproteobacteria bacterium]|jgi:predicted acetyltransferase|nr:GNAT family N-acetyltransferase [Alphaproteobacteria bacterium]
MLRLIFPDTRYLSSYIAALREGFRIGVRAIPSEEEIQSIEKDAFDHFESFNRQGGTFKAVDGMTYPRVQDNTYWLVDDKEFIGAINLRIQLNDFLAKHGGHIGYGVRPSMWRRGYATNMLSLLLEKAKLAELKKVMLTADAENIGSWKAIESNGGVLTSTLPSIFIQGNTTRIYWIDLL